MYVYKKKIYIVFFSIIDFLGNIISFPFRMFKSDIPKSLKKILLIREDHVGDVISSTVVLTPLRRAFPGADIDFLAPSWGMGILKGDPNLTKLIKFDPPWFDRGVKGFVPWMRGFFDMVKIIREGDYDLVIDLRGDARHIIAMFVAGTKYRLSYGITGCGFLLTHQIPYKGTMHENRRNAELLKPLGIECYSPGIKLYFSDEDILDAGNIKREVGIDYPYAVIHIVPGHPEKKWNKESFARVARYIHDEKALVPVFIGTDEDRADIKDVIEKAGVKAINLSGMTSLSMLGPILTGASLFVGLDSGPSHIAAYTEAPTVILFSGANDPAQWAPEGANVNVIYPGRGKDLSCIDAGEVFRMIDKVLQK